MKSITRTFVASSLLLAFSGSVTAAGLFDGGLPTGWTVDGGSTSAGTSAADGDVGLAPGGGARYGWVSTASGLVGVGALPGIGAGNLANAPNGSTLTSTLFSATAGQNLRFFFNYVTSDGAGFADYGWARLLDGGANPVAVLFTARTTPPDNGVPQNSVPGFGLPPIAATLTPGFVSIPDVFVGGQRIGPTWSPLTETPGACFAEGCGLTGWVQSDYTIAAAGNYLLQFGVTNWDDNGFQSGLAFDGITVGGTPIDQVPVQVVPVPGSILLLASGLVGLLSLRRRSRI